MTSGQTLRISSALSEYNWEKRMKHAEYFRQFARLCRILSKTSGDPELVDQMRVWAVDFADEADKVERRVVERDRHRLAGFSNDRSRRRQPGRRYTTSESRDDRKRRVHR
jgi:hypothetical protein